MVIYLGQDTRYHLLLFHSNVNLNCIILTTCYGKDSVTIWSKGLRVTYQLVHENASPVSLQQREGELTEIKSFPGTILLAYPAEVFC